MTRTKQFAQGKPFLLCISTAAQLRDIRGRVFGTRFPVVSIGTIAELKALPKESAFRVLVLCHSLSTQECESALHLARARWPAIKVLSITTPFEGCIPKSADAEVSGLAGPKAMFQSIEELLGEASHMSGASSTGALHWVH